MGIDIGIIDREDYNILMDDGEEYKDYNHVEFNHVELDGEIPEENKAKDLFTMNYFRSSYNESGIERVGAYYIGKYPLAYTFGWDGETSFFNIDWGEARWRCAECIEEFYIKSQEPKCEHLEWYTDAMRIVLMTIDCILSKENPSRYGLSWSY